MKFLVLLAVLAVAYLVWRHSRVGQRNDPPPAPPERPGTPVTQDMVSCPVCHVHLPRGDAVAGADGRLYCSQEHRLGAGP